MAPPYAPSEGIGHDTRVVSGSKPSSSVISKNSGISLVGCIVVLLLALSG